MFLNFKCFHMRFSFINLLDRRVISMQHSIAVGPMATPYTND